MKQIFTLAFLGLSTIMQSQGLRLTSPEVLAAAESFEMDIAGFGTNIPSAHNMLKYAPPALIQTGGTCVGFSASYCAQSTMINKASNTTMPIHKYVLCMDPYFLFSIANSQLEVPCEEGMMFEDIFSMMKEVGNKRVLMTPYVSCEFRWYDNEGILDQNNWETALKASLPFRIERYGPLDLEQPSWITPIKQYISNDIPIIVGAEVKDDFSPNSYGGSIQDDGVYKYTASPGDGSGHAMCILGYDDQKAGGSFLVRNSWGEGFGVNGNFWLKYSDFRSFVSEAWVIIPENWNENLYEADDYNFEFKSTETEDLVYGRADWETSIYEGFYKKDEIVLAHELFDSGAIYYGSYLNLIKHGFGVLWDNEGNKYAMEFNQGRLVEETAGFAGAQGSGIEMQKEISQILEAGAPPIDFVGEFPESGYKGE
jgi:hypothetical protein